MKEKIQDKISEIEDYLNVLNEIAPNSFEEYKSSYEKKWSCERGFENIVEAIIDLAFLVINEKQFKKKEDDLNVFDILAENNIISLELSKKMQDAKGMRNIIVHEYGKIDDEIVFEAISSELERDVRNFINIIKIRLNGEVD